MANGVVYSTNAFLKFQIQEKYLKQHFAWCSDNFDTTAFGHYATSALVPPSSSPADIFRQLREDARRSDFHSAKINQQKASLSALAIDWEKTGRIDASQRDEILYMTQHAAFDHWRPLVYVVPVPPISSRMKLVPIDRRAGFGDEFIIEDLKRNEFDLLEF